MSASASPAGDAPPRTLELRRGEPAWSVIRFAELAVTSYDATCREATAMAVTELAENVVKYGVPAADRCAGAIAVECPPGVVRIRASTRVVRSPEEAECAIETVARIARAASSEDLYRRRLAALLDDPSLPRARLGLLRIAFEGGFRLSCTYDGTCLEIVAERACEHER